MFNTTYGLNNENIHNEIMHFTNTIQTRLFNRIDFPTGFKHNGVVIDVDEILQW